MIHPGRCPKMFPVGGVPNLDWQYYRLQRLRQLEAVWRTGFRLQQTLQSGLRRRSGHEGLVCRREVCNSSPLLIAWRRRGPCLFGLMLMAKTKLLPHVSLRDLRVGATTPSESQGRGQERKS